MKWIVEDTKYSYRDSKKEGMCYSLLQRPQENWKLYKFIDRNFPKLIVDNSSS